MGRRKSGPIKKTTRKQHTIQVRQGDIMIENGDTVHSMRKEISELRLQVQRLDVERVLYRTAILNIYDAISNLKSGDSLNPGWVLSKIRGLLR